MSGPVRSYQGYDRPDQITGEAVAVELPVASLPSRFLARLIDTILSAILLLVLFVSLSILSFDYSGAVQSTVAILVIVTILVVIPVVVETLTRGRSLGKVALGLRTVRDDGGPITVRQSLARALIAPLEIYAFAGAPALVSALVTSRVKRLGDLAAGTYVIAERHHVRLPPRPTVHPALAGWAQSADIAALPTGLALALRQFLPRASTMTPSAREQLGRDLLTQTLAYVAPPPPAGWHPEWILASVLAERGTRDAGRLARESALRQRVIPPDALSGSRG